LTFDDLVNSRMMLMMLLMMCDWLTLLRLKVIMRSWPCAENDVGIVGVCTFTFFHLWFSQCWKCCRFSLDIHLHRCNKRWEKI